MDPGAKNEVLHTFDIHGIDTTVDSPLAVGSNGLEPR